MRWLAGWLTLVVVPLLLAEFTDWCPWLAKRLIRRAVLHLPRRYRGRYREEWLAILERIPGKLSVLFTALSLYARAASMGRAVRGLPSFGDTLKERLAAVTMELSPRKQRQRTRDLRATVLLLSEREQELKDGLRRELATADKLRAADEMKDTFLRAVSHDLHTPLTAMLGVAVTLERTRLNLPREQSLDLLGMLIQKTCKLERLLKDLLDLNRLEEGLFEPNRSLTDVRELVHRVVTEVDQLAGWPIDIEAEPIQAFIDGPKVERIVENLLLNTTRHTPPGTRVWVKALARGSDLELIVEDAGPGVPAELAGTIFEPFRQGPVRTLANHRGVGIGLSLVARFAALHGGQAWVEERWGGGASFHVLLPNSVNHEHP